jgi:hypothetical protein
MASDLSASTAARGSGRLAGLGRWLLALALPAVAAGLVAVGLGWLPPAQRVLEERRQRVEAMSGAQKDELLRRQRQFEALSPTKKQRVRALYDDLQQASDGSQLHDIMRHYSQWLATLAPYHRAELQELRSDHRIEQIKRLQAGQVKRSAQRLTAKDREGIMRWLERYAREHEGNLLELFPEPRRRQLAKATDSLRRRAVLSLLLERWQTGSALVSPPMSDKQLLELRSVLSAETARRLDGKPPAEQARTIAGYFRQTAREELAVRRRESFSLPAYDEQLAEFFEYQLSDERRDWLMSLPGEEMQHRLRELYVSELKGRDAPPHRPKPKKGSELFSASTTSDKKGPDKRKAAELLSPKKAAPAASGENSSDPFSAGKPMAARKAPGGKKTRVLPSPGAKKGSEPAAAVSKPAAAPRLKEPASEPSPPKPTPQPWSEP